MSYRFIVLEGIDGCGKSSLAKIVGCMLNALVVKTTIPRDDKYLQRCDFFPQARYLYYLSSLLLVSATIHEERRSRHIVSDRYLPSTLAYHGVLGVETDIVDITRVMLEKPDKTILLSASNDELVRRIRQRDGSQQAADYMARLPWYRQIEEKMKPHVDEVLDTTGRALADIATEICSLSGV